MRKTDKKRKILFLCGVFAKENTEEVVKNARYPVEFSANLFQQKIVEGLESSGEEYEVLSAPFIGAYPKASSKMIFRGFEEKTDYCKYVNFNNIWGYRNFSRAVSLKKQIRKFASEKEEKLIIVYCAHTPFLEAAAYAKKKDKNIKICLIVPDLPEYMNLRSDRSKLYNILKKYDIKKMHGLMRNVDSFVILTEHMKDLLPIGSKPYIVKEGIVSKSQMVQKKYDSQNEKYVVYTGKMDEKFGVKNLVDAFDYIKEDIKLVLCGSGDCENYIREKAEKDSRIIYCGQILPEQAKQWQEKATVLINPRPNNEEYTKYSFPSKNIEYLLTGKPVVAYMLDGMPEEYKRFIFVIGNELSSAEEIAKATIKVIEEKQSVDSTYLEYVKENIEETIFIEDIMGMS